tara:strand:+ start:5064 stop:5711 length:648 start_codon:yes stop_codon:yes gene_type:complete
MSLFVENESYKHKYSKNVVKEWLDNGLYLFDDTYITYHDSGMWHRNSSVFLEYPVTILDERYCNIQPHNSLYNSWDEIYFYDNMVYNEYKVQEPSRDNFKEYISWFKEQTIWNVKQAEPFWINKCSGYVPTYEESNKYGNTIAICDLAVIHKGLVLTAIEICHKNPVSEEKIKNLYKSGLENLIELDAEWVMRQVKQPEKIKVKRWLIKNGEIIF